jgi:hypothetical protein
MPCQHKFYKYLSLEKLDFKPQTLIIGTFNPLWPPSNEAEWFYGRYENHFWEVLPRIYGEQSLKESGTKEWKAFCCRKQIAITDLIKSIDDAHIENIEHNKLLGTFSDKNIAEKFHNHSLTDIIGIIEKNPSIKNVYLTRGVNETFWKRLWRPIYQHCKKHQIQSKTLLTPSGYAFYQINRFNKKHPNNQVNTTQELILREWQEEWHFKKI